MINRPTITYLEESPKGRCTERHIRVSFPEFYEELNGLYNEFNIPFREKLYWYFHNITQIPTCKCGKPIKYINFIDGYLEHCSYKCAFDDPHRMKKIKQTKLERYGDENYSNPEQIIKTNIERHGGLGFGSPKINEKIKQTTLEKYGVEHSGSSEEIRQKTLRTNQERYGGTAMGSPETRKKIEETNIKRYGNKTFNNRSKAEQTCLERYGVENVSQVPEVQEKFTQTIRERYGVDHPGQIPGIREKSKQTCLERYGVDSIFKLEENKMKAKRGRWKIVYKENPDVIKIEQRGDRIVYTCSCPHDPQKCKMDCDGTYETPCYIRNCRKFQKSELCTKLLPINYDRGTGTSLELFIRSILDDHKINYETNNRTILDGKELDLYLPDHKLAIECNGVYWHSLKEPKYHFNKWKQCKEQGIQLLTIWEDQIINKPEIIKNIVLSKLGIYEHKVGARECTIKETSYSEAHEFLSIYHLQGSVAGSVRLGLYHNDELVSLMVFGRKRTSLGNKKHDTWELYRYCTKAGWTVMGGAKRLLSHFCKEHPDTILESFSSNDISIGTLYKKLGFELESVQSGSYWYIDKEMNRYHRYSFRKDVLVREGYDPNLTEFEITDGIGLFRIYDSGQQKWVLQTP